ncbi:MAG: hypothetical protein GXO67_05185, partial [Archaeoglobi archaeon]|nr:hypothetical protein [Archaeoglobi archaeon]
MKLKLSLGLRRKKEEEPQEPQEGDGEAVETQGEVEAAEESRFEVVEEYWIEEPRSKIQIVFDPESGEYEYHVIEPVLNDYLYSVFYVVKHSIVE